MTRISPHLHYLDVGKISGFTLIELLISMGLIVPFLVVIVWLMSVISNSQLYLVSYDAAARESQYAALVMEHDANRIISIDYPATAGGTYDRLTIMTDSGPVTIASSEGRLIRTDSTGSAYLLSSRSKVDSFAVSRTGTESSYLQIDLDVIASISGTREPVVISRTVAHQIK